MIDKRKWICLFGLIIGLGVAANAATIYQTASMPQGTSWNDAAYWDNVMAPASENDYINDLGGNTRTPIGGGTFAGDTLTLRNASALTLKNGGDVATVNLIMENNTQVANGGGGTAKLNGTLTGSGAITFYNQSSSRTIELGSLISADNTFSSVSITGPGTVSVINPANNFSGTWDVQDGRLQGVGFGAADFNVATTNGVLDFNYDFSGATSELDCKGVLKLDQDLTFLSATIDGVVLTPGTYDAAALITTNGISASALEDGLASSGSITVLSEPLSEFTFDANAKPVSLVLNGKDMLGSSSANGFYLRHFDGKDYSEAHLDHAVISNNFITVSESGSLPNLTFRIDSYPKHVSIHLVGTDGIPLGDRQYGIRLRMLTDRGLGYPSLNDVPERGGWTRSAGTRYLKWQNLEGALLDGDRGGYALYDAQLEGAALDQCVASVWVNEDLPSPAGQASWEEQNVLNWVAAYQAQLGGMTQVALEADNPTDLYALTDTIAIPTGVKRVYLHTKTWRGEYWPNYNSFVHVNTDVFPTGKPDLKGYADYLATNNIMLRLHSVSCGIGKNDSDYIVGSVDRRLASWGGGVLEYPAGASDTTLYFRPDEGVNLPIHAGGINYYEYVRIGEEIVKVGAFKRTEEEVWRLDGCERGYGGTDPSAHSAGTDAGGLYNSYHRNFVPEYDLDQTNSLMDYMALEYATFANDLQLGHLHYDGPEIHRIMPWVERELFDRIYSYTDHPVTSSRVGRPIAANFELYFSELRDDLSLQYWPLEVGVRLDDPAKIPATSRLDTHFHCSEGIMLGGRRVSLGVPQSGYALSMDELDNHGLMGEVLDLFGYWLEIIPVLHDDDVDYIDDVMDKTPGSNHYQTEDVLVLGKNGSDQYIFTPRHVMGRTSVEDDPFKIHQEKGTVARKQLIQSGDTITVSNPHAAQELDFIIRVDKDESQSLTNPTVQIGGGAGTLSVTGSVAPGQYLSYEGGTTAQLYDVNWNLISNLPITKSSFNVTAGSNSLAVVDGTGASVDIETQFIVTGTVYILKTNDNL